MGFWVVKGLGYYNYKVVFLKYKFINKVFILKLVVFLWLNILLGVCIENKYRFFFFYY